MSEYIILVKQANMRIKDSVLHLPRTLLLRVSYYYITHGDHSYITSAKELGERFRNMAIVADGQYLFMLTKGG